MTTTNQQSTVAVVGGGIAGLVAANEVAAAGHRVVLLEKAASLGGRAATREKHGFFFNLGPHALYREGVLRETLRRYGINPTGAIPGGNGGFALYEGRWHTLPTGFVSLLTTGVLSLPAKMEFATLLSTIASIDASAAQGESLASWLRAHIRHERVRELIRMLARVTTFTNDPDRQSAGATIAQLQLATKGNVLYVDRGWQTIVDALRTSAIARGVDVRTAAPVVSLDRRRPREASAVRLADGSFVPADVVIMTGAPSDVDALAGTRFAATLPPPVRHATLDIALRSLPNPKRTVAFGVDAPVYFSVHSAVATLAPPGGALIHVSRYLRPDETTGHEIEHELEQIVDVMQPGWRDLIDARQFLPNLTVTHAEVTAAQGGLAGRPSTRLEQFDNVFIAGDWVGPRGQLSDAAAASAIDAGAAAIAAGLKACATDAHGVDAGAQPFRAALVS